MFDGLIFIFSFVYAILGRIMTREKKRVDKILFRIINPIPLSKISYFSFVISNLLFFIPPIKCLTLYNTRRCKSDRISYNLFREGFLFSQRNKNVFFIGKNKFIKPYSSLLVFSRIERYFTTIKKIDG